MAKAERLSNRLDALERDYRAVLLAALTECAEGKYGLFGQNEHLGPYWNCNHLKELREMAVAINAIRARLGETTFALHDELEAARGRPDPDDPGEPKVAQAWLQRLGTA
jgi:hypothetical protein